MTTRARARASCADEKAGSRVVRRCVSRAAHVGWGGGAQADVVGVGRWSVARWPGVELLCFGGAVGEGAFRRIPAISSGH
jgi:hypothetical protein